MLIRYNNPDLELITYICNQCGTEWVDQEAIYWDDETGAECCLACDKDSNLNIQTDEFEVRSLLDEFEMF